MTDNTQPEALRALAEAAKWTGKWYDAGCNTVYCTYDKEDSILHDEIAHPVPFGVSGYIAAAHPQSVIALLDRIAELESELKAIGAGGVQALSAAPAVHASVKGAMWFTKKPVTIQAIQWTGDNLREVITFTDGPPDTRSHHAGMAWDAYRDLVARDGLKIYTLEGKMLASPGDWIIRGVKGELYPCKPDIFQETYAAASPTPPAEQQAQPGAVYAELPQPDSWFHFTAQFWENKLRDFADRTHALRMQAAPKAAPAQQEWRLVLPGGKYTDKWESARIGDYNRGWNDYRKTAIAALNSVVWPARTSGSWVGASTWLRNNYQDYPNIASLCDAMLEAAPQQEAQRPWGYAWRQSPFGWGFCSKQAYEQAAGRGEEVAKLYTAPQPAPAPLSGDVVKDAARWRMVALIGYEVMLHPEKRTQAAAVKAYMDATHSGSDLTGAVDAALAAQKDTP